MRVCCERLEDATGTPAEASAWLTVGREYIVLEVLADASRGVELRLEGDDADGGPGLWRSDLFSVVDGRLPELWTASLGEEAGAITIGPAEWQTDGFWERFYDRDPEAKSVYKSARDRLLGEYP